MISIKNNLIVRKEETKWINKFFLQKEGGLITVTGRRKVGKSTFIEQSVNDFLEDLRLEEQYGLYLKFTASNVLTSKENLLETIKSLNFQLENYLFKEELNLKKEEIKDIEELLLKFKQKRAIKNWSDFFQKLIYFLNEISKKHQIKLFLFFDEVAWYSKRQDFYNAFAHCFNLYLQQNANCKIVFASSTNSWIKKNVLENKGSMYQRAFSLPIHLKPFTFEEVFAYCQHLYKNINKEELLEYYLMFGGIIKYYQLIDLSKSFEKNLDFINKNKDVFHNERKILLESLFYPSLKFLAENIISILSKKKKASVKEIEKELNKIKNKKTFNFEFEKELEERKVEDIKNLKTYEVLNDLVNSGLLQKLKPNSHSVREQVFFINDAFAYFEYYWMNNNKKITQGNDFNNWKGNAFEIFIFNHFEIVKDFFEFNDGELFLNLNIKDKNKGKNQNQIDLFYKEKTNSKENYHLIELKFYKENYLFNSQEIKELNKKGHALRKMLENNKKKKFNINIILIGLNALKIDETELDFSYKSLNFKKEFL